MRLIALGLLAGLALTSAASAQSGSMGTTNGLAGMSGPATAGGLGDNAGSIAAAANSAANPSGNSFITPSPGTGAPIVGRLAR